MSEQQPQQQSFFDGNPRQMFAFGLVSGIAAILLMNNFLGTSYATGGGNNDEEEPAVVVNNGDDTGTVTSPTKLSDAVTEDDHVRGDLKKAKVVVVEYSDFECPFCQRHHPTMQQLYDKYGEDIAWVYRHFPLSFHANAEAAALASECAAEQGKFWEYADGLFENQDKFGDDFFIELAGDLKLNTAKFQTCYDEEKYQDKVDADTASGRASGVSGTPATFINGTLVSGSTGKSVGAAPLATFTAIVDAALK